MGNAHRPVKPVREFLTLSHVSKSFGGVQALKDVSLGITPGRTCWLAGENGSGKSTLIKVVAGIHAPDSGEIAIDGSVCARLHPIEAIRRGIQVIYQDLSLFPNLSVAENIALNYEIAHRRRWVRWREVEAIAARALGRIGVELDPGARAGDLPVADRQIIAIARALLHDARLVIMDEPTTALTRKEVSSLFEVIRNLKAEGIAVLFVGHKLDEMVEIAERVFILRNGEKVVDAEAAGLDPAAVVRAITGRDPAPEMASSPAAAASAPLLLKVAGLAKSGCFSGVSFELRAGEILGITGQLGSGRTELALSLFGVLPADSGSVAVGGRRVGLKSIREARANGIGYVPEDRLTEGLFLDQSVGSNAVAAIIDRLRGRSLLLDRDALRARAAEWVGRLDIRPPSVDLPAASLSGGNQQRLVLAKWLATEPGILILNGPTVGVDVGSKAEIHRIIRTLAGRGMGLLVISDDIPELAHLCDRVLLMKQGRVAAELERRNLWENTLTDMLMSA